MKDTGVILGVLRDRAREYEKHAIQIRNFARLAPAERLNPFGLATRLGMKVVMAKDIPDISESSVKTLLIDKANEWSGASSGVQQDGSTLIVLNSTHSPTRQVATLMEEICHVLLGHRRNRISSDLLGARDYHRKIEAEAFGVGAATLVPFVGLTYFLERGLVISEIANRFGVSPSLVKYRIKVVTHMNEVSKL